MNRQNEIQEFLAPFRTMKESGKKITYCLPHEQLKQLPINPWSRQRTIDEQRASEIKDYIISSGDVPGIISLAYHPMEKLIVYDGQHRWKALTMMIPIKALVIIEILWDAEIKDIEESFQLINKCVPLTDLHTSADSEVRFEIERFVSKFVKDYKTLVSSSNQPKRPNFNQHMLESDIYKLYSEDFAAKFSIQRILKAITSLNEDYDSHEHSEARTSLRGKPAYDKCEVAHMWLFAKHRQLSAKEIQKKL